MPPIVVAVPGCEAFAERLVSRLDGERAATEVRCFPDGEVYVRIDTPVAGRDVVLACSLDRPGEKLLPLLFLAHTAKDLGARSVGLVAPYLSFLRQDSRFRDGEGVTSAYFAKMVSASVDWLVTVDPHLHRLSSLDQVYSIPSRVVRAAPAIARWLGREVERPLLIGPDAESAQWVAAVAELCQAPFVILEKIRRGDRDVSVSTPEVEQWRDRRPVVLDDIISTGRTMIEAVRQLGRVEMTSPICVAVHAVFSDSAHDELVAAGATQVVTCNTIPHHSNRIAVDDDLATTVREMIAG